MNTKVLIIGSKQNCILRQAKFQQVLLKPSTEITISKPHYIGIMSRKSTRVALINSVEYLLDQQKECWLLDTGIINYLTSCTTCICLRNNHKVKIQQTENTWFSSPTFN